MIFLYRTLWLLLTPWLLWYFLSRKILEPSRLGEYFGSPSRERPHGRLCWIHAPSLGESFSVEPLIHRLLTYPKLSILVTTSTRTSAKVLASRLPSGAFHQFSPLDTPITLWRFLNYWKPDFAIRVETDIWPEAFWQLSRRKIPRAMIQARMTDKTFAHCKRWTRFIHLIFRGFDPVIPLSKGDFNRFQELGFSNLKGPFNLKGDALVPGEDRGNEVKEKLHQELKDRDCWVAASTHPADEEVVLDAHFQLRQDFPNLLTIIIPRYPKRGVELEKQMKSKGLKVTRRSQREQIGDAEIYLADTLGETGLFYGLVDIAFVGGTFDPRGGHNLFEPAKMACGVLHGPHISNQIDIAKALAAEGASRKVHTAGELTKTLHRCFSKPEEVLDMKEAAQTVILKVNSVTEQVEELLRPLIEGCPSTIPKNKKDL